MKSLKSRRNIFFFVLSRLGVVVGLVIFLASSSIFLFIPQTVPVSIRLSKFDSLTLAAKNNDCSSVSSLVQGNGFVGIPPLHITNRATIMSRFELSARDKVFPFRIILRSMKLKISLVKGNEVKDIGEYSFPEGDEVEYVGTAQFLNVIFDSYEPVHQSIYYCDSTIIIPGDYLSQPIEAGSALIQSFTYGEKAYISLSGGIEVSQLDIQEPYDEIVFTLEPMVSTMESNFSVYADKLYKGSKFPYTVSDTDKDFLLDVHSIEAHSNTVEISSPTGVIKIGNSDEIKLSALTKTSEQSLVLSPSILNKNSDDLSIETNPETGELEIFGTAESIRLNDQEMGLVIWNKLPEYVQTGVLGLIITAISASFVNFKKVTSFFKPISNSFSGGEFVCETQSGYIIAGQLVQKPTKAFPFYVLNKVRRRLRTSNEWDIIPTTSFMVSASDVEQYYEVIEKLD